ncbi:copper homeostasis protein [Hamadaea flava]|uniref:Copper homeostasis protein cutC homolog n=1 Tax=Hamadaea flava TaxID=1742688 RepID=A0ABV8M1C6_9ACTN|nr:copper homeostasis protein CutC [Hamadaea flava]MCP2325744.1 copper homeostasis protein [Hamadaea flava]
MTPLLEVIALSPADAEAAQAGGADRLELVAQMSADGLSPTPSVAAAVVAATDLPVRAMLRTTADFAAGPDLVGLADELLATGVAGLVFGFLDDSGEVDVATCERIAERLHGRPWTFHRAIDHARDTDRAWVDVLDLPGVDAVLTAGSPVGVREGWVNLVKRDPSRVLAGGGLTEDVVPALLDAGIRAFHVGSTAREDGLWTSPVCPSAVGRWRALLS